MTFPVDDQEKERNSNETKDQPSASEQKNTKKEQPENAAESAADVLLFTGSYQHSLDSKGRMIVPQQYREALGRSFVIGPSFNFKAIALYPEAVWRGMRTNYQQLARFNSKLKLYLENFDAMSYRAQECDAQGRVLLPSRIRQKLIGDDKDVDVLGSGDCIRIVARPKSDEQFLDFLEHMDDTMTEIDRLGAAQPPEFG